MTQQLSSEEDNTFDVLFGEGTRLLHAGQVTQAMPLLEKAHEFRLEHVDAAINLGAAYILEGKFTKAVAVLEPLTKTQPDQVMVWTNLGAAYLGNPVLATDQQRAKAIAAFRQAYELNPATPNVAYNLGLIYRDMADPKQAIYWFNRAIKANPNDKDARSLRERLEKTLGSDESHNLGE